MVGWHWNANIDRRLGAAAGTLCIPRRGRLTRKGEFVYFATPRREAEW